MELIISDNTNSRQKEKRKWWEIKNKRKFIQLKDMIQIKKTH